MLLKTCDNEKQHISVGYFPLKSKGGKEEIYLLCSGKQYF